MLIHEDTVNLVKAIVKKHGGNEADVCRHGNQVKVLVGLNIVTPIAQDVLANVPLLYVVSNWNNGNGTAIIKFGTLLR